MENVRDILWSFGIFYGHLVYFWPFGNVKYIFPRVGNLCHEKSGNPDADATIKCKETVCLKKTGYFKLIINSN
jgi:hypothetical protein